MIKSILAIQSQIEMLISDMTGKVNQLKDQARQVLNKHMDKPKVKKTLTKMMVQVDNSRDIYLDEFDGWVIQFARVDFSDLGLDLENDLVKTLLVEYFQDLGPYGIDLKNSVITLNCGPAILVNDEGDVLDQDGGKWIVSKGDYETIEERNSQIEAYMDKTGYFPSVIKCDRYGNASYIDTKPKSQNETKGA